MELIFEFMAKLTGCKIFKLHWLCSLNPNVMGSVGDLSMPLLPLVDASLDPLPLEANDRDISDFSIVFRLFEGCFHRSFFLR
jgi:hypothetical protein